MCLEALHLSDGDVGLAYEYLFTQCFLQDNNMEKNTCERRSQLLSDNNMIEDNVLELREEEITALKAIYEDNFSEKLQNKSWTLKFECQCLRDLVFKPEKSGESTTAIRKADEICKFHLKGGCRFGHRCRYIHDIQNKNIQEVDDRHLKQEVDLHFELDLRFVKDNLYPLEPPVIGFSALDPEFPPYISLNITEHMVKEAKMYCESQSPIVFALVSLLEDEILLKELVEKMPMESSLPQYSSPSWKPQLNFDSSIAIEKQDNKYAEKELEVDDKDVEAMINMIEKHDSKEDNDCKVEIKRSTSRDSDDLNRSPGELLKLNKRLKDEFTRKQVKSFILG